MRNAIAAILHVRSAFPEEALTTTSAATPTSASSSSSRRPASTRITDTSSTVNPTSQDSSAVTPSSSSFPGDSPISSLSGSVSHTPTGVEQPSSTVVPVRQTTTASTKSSHSNGDLSNGAVAGIAVGCAILGALIAIGVLFFLMGDRLKKKHRSNATSSRQPGRSSSKQAGFVTSTLRQRPINGDKDGAVRRPVDEVTAETVLEQPKDDGSVKQSVAALFKAIDDHVGNYYIDTPSRSGRSAKEPTMQSSHLPTGIALQSGLDFEGLLADRLSRPSAITSLITAQVLDAIDFFGVTEKSLLPDVVTTFLRSSAGQIKDNQRSRLNLSRWRTSTANLLGLDDNPRRVARSQRAIDDLIADIDSIIAPYVRPETDKDRRLHLAKICKRAEELGLMLLSQPAEWRFHWSDAPNAQNTAPTTHRSEKSKKPIFVVQPQLRRVTDDVARKLDPQLIVLDCQVLH